MIRKKGKLNDMLPTIETQNPIIASDPPPTGQELWAPTLGVKAVDKLCDWFERHDAGPVLKIIIEASGYNNPRLDRLKAAASHAIAFAANQQHPFEKLPIIRKLFVLTPVDESEPDLRS